MPGRKPKIQLLVQAVDSAGCRVSAIPVLISEELVVSSPGLSCHASLCFSLVLPAAVYCWQLLQAHAGDNFEQQHMLYN